MRIPKRSGSGRLSGIVPPCSAARTTNRRRSWEQAAVFQLEKLAKENVVFSYVRNDRLEFNIPYELYGNPQVYEPDFIVRLRNDVSVVLEIKGKSFEDTDAKHQAAKRWVSAVNYWGELGEWDFFVCREPQQLADGFAKLIA